MSTRGRLLVIDDEPDILDNCRLILEREGYEVTALQDSTTVGPALADVDPDVVLTDLMIPGLDGMSVLARVRETHTDVPVVMMTAYATVETAVEAMKAGASDYIVKPFSKDQLVLVIDRVMRSRELMVENRRLRAQLDRQDLESELIAHSPSMQEVLSLVARIRETNTSVMIRGESGSGKEVVARAIHRGYRGGRTPFVAINCSALPGHLIESELFGYEKGAFTGAAASRRGMIEEADGGTFFLDEISEMDSAMQAKLLRAIQEKRVRRLGGNRETEVDVRIISATNREPEEAVKAGQLREDLYYRLAVVKIALPPLRERREDIPALARHFLGEFSSSTGRVVKGFTPQVMDLLIGYFWPGNVRELRNVIERAVSLSAREMIREEDLPEEIRHTSPRQIRVDFTEPYSEAKARALDRFQREYFEALLKEESYNITRVAERARVDRKTIYRIMKTYGLDRDNGESSP